MDTSLIGSTTASAASNTSKNVSLAQDEFFALLTSQLTNQDPLSPMEAQDFLGQLAQLNTLQATAALTETLNATLLQQTFGSATNLLNKVVRGIAQNGQEVTGIASAVSIEGGKVLVLVNDQPVPMDSILEVVSLGV